MGIWHIINWRDIPLWANWISSKKNWILPLGCDNSSKIPENTFLEKIEHNLQKKRVHKSPFLNTEIDSAISNYVKPIFTYLAYIFKSDLLKSVKNILLGSI